MTNYTKNKRALILFEFSGVVRNAFSKVGYDSWSCDIIPTESEGNHYQMDALDVLNDTNLLWDIIIMHPPCTHMALCGNSTWAGTKEREDAVLWTKCVWEKATSICSRVCMENPASVLFKRLGIKAQWIQPYQFGHPETKKTGLALHGLPRLMSTKNVYDYMLTLPKKEQHRTHYMSPSKTRGKDRSVFFSGIAEAMAKQWG